MTTKPAFPALGAPMSPSVVAREPPVEELALPKSLKSCNFTSARLSSGGCRLKLLYGKHLAFVAWWRGVKAQVAARAEQPHP
jgi:hypothetical protein